MLTTARGQILSFWNPLDCLMVFHNDARNAIDCKVYGKSNADRSSTNNDNISMHRLLIGLSGLLLINYLLITS